MNITKYNPDSIRDLEQTDLVRLSRDLLESVVKNTGVLNRKKMSKEALQEYKTVLGFLNASTKTIQVKMQVFKMMGVGEKVKAVQKRNKQ